MGMSKVKGSSNLFNILMVALGLLFILKAVLEFAALMGIFVPRFLEAIIEDLEGAEALSLFGGQGLISLFLGLWCMISGIGMFREAEWAMGQALVVLSLMVVVSIPTVISWIATPDIFDYKYWPNYIVILAFLMGVFGFIYLLITRKRFA